jgi:hypothetical protein
VINGPVPRQALRARQPADTTSASNAGCAERRTPLSFLDWFAGAPMGEAAVAAAYRLQPTLTGITT